MKNIKDKLSKIDPRYVPKARPKWCPFCEKVASLDRLEVSEKGVWFIRCLFCDATGPGAHRPDIAVRFWNEAYKNVRRLPKEA